MHSSHLLYRPTCASHKEFLLIKLIRQKPQPIHINPSQTPPHPLLLLGTLGCQLSQHTTALPHGFGKWRVLREGDDLGGDERCVFECVAVGWSGEVVGVDFRGAFVGHVVVDWVD